jgi:acetyltransferase-like isoleucine patch superfamily enzyme
MFKYLKNILQLYYNRFRFPSAKLEFGSKVSLNSKLGKHVKIFSSSQISSTIVADFTYISSGSIISDTEIGSFCSIGPNVLCNIGKHPIHLVSTYPGFYSKLPAGSKFFGIEFPFEEKSKVYIGSDVWIGARAIILSGIKIGNGAIIGAGSIVTKDVPPYAIVVGSPAKIIKYRFSEDIIERLLVTKWWDLSETKLKSIVANMDNVELFLKVLNNE